VTLEEFNALPGEEARARIRPALDVPRWVDAVADGRPYAHRDALLETARTAAEPLSDEEVDRALSHHPRIGDRAEGSSAEAALSRREQAAVDPDDAALQQALREGNLAYEERFGRVFLIRAAGRTPQQILDALRIRLEHDEATERGVLAEQLRQIALLRLDGMVEP
jgi:2-oxo-4-hydroxy-4-carboxy-5-ureidoimidazoline decarboxylase